jgi:biopolymer transport protein TolR
MQEFDPEEDAITGINVTPLVDITLVLLIIFMVTARYITEPSIGVQLPKASSTAQASSVDNNVYLTIDQQHRVFLNNKQVERGDLSNQIKTLLQQKPALNLVLRADSRIEHGEVISILDQVRKEGVTQFGIAVEGTPK